MSYIGINRLDPHSKVGGARAVTPTVNMKEPILRKTGVSWPVSGEGPGSSESSLRSGKEFRTAESHGATCISNLQDMQPNRACSAPTPRGAVCAVLPGKLVQKVPRELRGWV